LIEITADKKTAKIGPGNRWGEVSMLSRKKTWLSLVDE
jgi:hypothetical protein